MDNETHEIQTVARVARVGFENRLRRLFEARQDQRAAITAIRQLRQDLVHEIDLALEGSARTAYEWFPEGKSGA